MTETRRVKIPTVSKKRKVIPPYSDILDVDVHQVIWGHNRVFLNVPSIEEFRERVLEKYTANRLENRNGDKRLKFLLKCAVAMKRPDGMNIAPRTLMENFQDFRVFVHPETKNVLKSDFIFRDENKNIWYVTPNEQFLLEGSVPKIGRPKNT